MRAGHGSAAFVRETVFNRSAILNRQTVFKPLNHFKQFKPFKPFDNGLRNTHLCTPCNRFKTVMIISTFQEMLRKLGEPRIGGPDPLETHPARMPFVE